MREHAYAYKGRRATLVYGVIMTLHIAFNIFIAVALVAAFFISLEIRQRSSYLKSRAKYTVRNAAGWIGAVISLIGFFVFIAYLTVK